MRGGGGLKEHTAPMGMRGGVEGMSFGGVASMLEVCWRVADGG